MAKIHRRVVPLLASSVLVTAVSTSLFAAPSGPHPRLWLNAETRTALAAQADVANSPVARGAARCQAAQDDPSEYEVGGWQGFEFVLTLSGCLVSWAATDDAGALETAIKYWKVLLDDYQTVGDAAGGDDVVTHDTGYAMRTFAPYSAIAYDWLHDAPGVTEELRAHARERFDAWVTYYSESGYLRHMPGANYQAGYLYAATLIAIAEAGEAGAAGDAHWATVEDVIWGDDMIPALGAGGVLEGGDWPEGWQYGPLSVTEYGLAARAMEQNGSAIPGAREWADSLVRRFAFGLTPVSKQAYPAGDSDNDMPNREPQNGALLAAIAGPASESAKSWARALNQELGLRNENPLFDALAAAVSGPSAAPAALPTNHLASGAGNFYLRSNWTDESVWSVFQCAPRLVDDHQHTNAGNFVLTRGADDLVVDPSPYGSLSTLTGNAPAVDSNSVPSGYSPSQAFWGETTEMTWARQSASGVAVARCDYADQFRYGSTASDVTSALRDYVLVPDGGAGEVVLVDRVVTGDAARALHFRVRTPGAFTLAGNQAKATVGASSLVVDRVYSSTGSGTVREMPRASECPSSDHTCDISRLPSGSEYRIDVPGPAAMAIHVVAARAEDAGAAHESLSGSGYRGVVVPRAGGSVVVVASDAVDGAVGSAFAYNAPGNAVHVVLDAPASSEGLSAVTATPSGTGCAVSVSPHAGATGGYPARPLIVRLEADCAVTDDGSAMEPDPTEPDPMNQGGAAGEGASEPPGSAGEDAGGEASGKGGMQASSAGTGGSGAGPGLGSGGAQASTGGSAPAVAGSAATSMWNGPVTPPPGGCSVTAGSESGGTGGALATALLGLGLLLRPRRGRRAPR
jgi:MYXO-CTERM domain-containing protein